MLCQSTYRDKRFRVVIGIGLNLSNREPTTCVNAAIEEERNRLQIPDAAEPVQPEARGAPSLPPKAVGHPLSCMLCSAYNPLLPACCAGAACGHRDQAGEHAGGFDHRRLQPSAAGLHRQLAAHRPTSACFSDWNAFVDLSSPCWSCCLRDSVCQQVKLEEGDGQTQPKERISLTVEGLTPHGFLRASDAAGHSYELHPDGNSLDFFQGLIRRKLPAA